MGTGSFQPLSVSLVQLIMSLPVYGESAHDQKDGTLINISLFQMSQKVHKHLGK